MVNVGEYTSPMDPESKYSDLQQHYDIVLPSQSLT